MFIHGLPPVPVRIYLLDGDSTELRLLCDLLLDLDRLILILLIGFGVYLFGETCACEGGYLIYGDYFCV